MKSKSNRTRTVAIAACVGVALSLPAWREVFRQRAAANEARLATKEVADRKADLLMQQANFENPARREEIMRGAGYMRDGEERVEGQTK